MVSLTLQILVAPYKVLTVLSALDVALFNDLGDLISQADNAEQTPRLVVKGYGTGKGVEGLLALHQLDADALLMEQEGEKHADGASADNEYV